MLIKRPFTKHTWFKEDTGDPLTRLVIDVTLQRKVILDNSQLWWFCMDYDLQRKLCGNPNYCCGSAQRELFGASNSRGNLAGQLWHFVWKLFEQSVIGGISSNLSKPNTGAVEIGLWNETTKQKRPLLKEDKHYPLKQCFGIICHPSLNKKSRQYHKTYN